MEMVKSGLLEALDSGVGGEENDSSVLVLRWKTSLVDKTYLDMTSSPEVAAPAPARLRGGLRKLAQGLGVGWGASYGKYQSKGRREAGMPSLCVFIKAFCAD